jgi:soluble lytic murein transglycosylase-like protein/cell wall-associated NlpC family hydrolase
VNEGLAAVQSRIAQLQALLGLQSGAALGGTGTASGSGTASGTDFAGTLADALGAASGTGTGTGSTTAGNAVGARAVALAKGYSGVPYLWGGNDPAKGLDCSGLTKLVFSKLGVTLPRVAADQAAAGTRVSSIAEAQAGDLVFFGSPIHHVGIYVGDGSMIDAPHTGSSVGVHKLWGTPTAIRRVTPAGTANSLEVTGGSVGANSIGTSGVSAAGATQLAAALQASVASLQASALNSTALNSSASDGSTTLPGLSMTEMLLSALPAGTRAALSPAATAGTAATDTSAAATGGLTGPYAALFTAAGRKHGVDPALLSAVATVESNDNPAAVSAAGARGLMQLMPATARSLGVNPDDPAQAVDGAARLLGGLLTRFGGRVDLALAGYNAGAGAVQRYGGVPPYPETRTYVQRVTKTLETLR